MKLQSYTKGSKKQPGEVRWSKLLRLVAVLDSVHELLHSSRHATPREIFYTHAVHFKRQHRSDALLKWLCNALEVPRHHLRLAGTAKGLVRGHLRMLEPSPYGPSMWIDGMDPLEPRGHSISPLCAHRVRAASMARTVLVVEKETVFHRLLDEGLLERHRPLILVTARGFPDIATRYFLRRLRGDLGGPRVLLLTDFDPFGFCIAATYAFGGEKTWQQEEDLTMPDAVPLLREGGGLPVPGHFGLHQEDALVLTDRDRAVARGLIKRLEGFSSNPGAVALRRAATELLQGGFKYELDALDDLFGFVSQGLRRS